MNYQFGPGLPPGLRDQLQEFAGMVGLPYIRGKWYHVDPTNGAVGASGKDEKHALKSIIGHYSSGVWVNGAYELMVDGDGCILHGYGATSAATTSYVTTPIDIAKNGLTFFGACAPSGVFPRARIANKRITTGAIAVISCQENTPAADTITRTTGSFLTDGFEPGMKIHMTGTSGTTNDGYYTIDTVTALVITLISGDDLTAEAAGSTITIINYMPYLIDLQSQNCVFYNISFWNSDTDAYSLGGVKVTGSRFAFIGCHIFGGGVTTPTANERSLELSGAACQDGQFVGCTFGSDTYDRGNNANTEIYFNGTTASARVNFKDCKTLAYASTGTAHLAVKSASATAWGRHILFENTKFTCYVPNLGADMASVFGGTGFNTAKVCFDTRCSMFGYALYDAATGNDCCFVAAAQGVAAGGKGIVAS